jgi:hypothetical protein
MTTVDSDKALCVGIHAMTVAVLVKFYHYYDRTGAEKSGLFCVVSTLLEKTQIDQEVSVANTVRQIKYRRSMAIPKKVGEISVTSLNLADKIFRFYSIIYRVCL